MERYSHRGAYVTKQYAGRVLGSAYHIPQAEALRKFEANAHRVFRNNRNATHFTDTYTGITLHKNVGRY